jgi:hypothetical protein
MPEQVIEICCANCRAFSDGGSGMTSCRRHAPTEHTGMFPNAWKNSWCMEFMPCDIPPEPELDEPKPDLDPVLVEALKSKRAKMHPPR